MPRRVDDYWASEKDADLLYCYKHERYYRADFGCQLCSIETIETHLNSPKITLNKCPTCDAVSLMWLSQNNCYECLNPKCKRTYTESEYKTLMETQDKEPQGKAWFGNEYFDPKKKKWRKP